MYTFFKVIFSSTQIMKNHKWNWRNSLHNIFSVLMTDEFTFILLVQTVNYHSGLAKQRTSLTNSVRVTSLALLSLTFNIPWKFRVEIRNEALCALRKLAESAFWWICLGKIFKEHGFLYLSLLRKALKPLTKIKALKPLIKITFPCV